MESPDDLDCGTLKAGHYRRIDFQRQLARHHVSDPSVRISNACNISPPFALEHLYRRRFHTMRVLKMKFTIPLLAALTFGLSLSADASDPWPKSLKSSVTSPDTMYDFNVLAAAPGPNIRFFLWIRYPDGTTRESGPYTHERDAWYSLWALYEREQVPPGTKIDVTHRDVGPIWQFVGTYPTRTEANSVADILESVGWDAVVIPVHIFTIPRPLTGGVLDSVR